METSQAAPFWGSLEVRKDHSGRRRLRGSFPYGATATLSDGGRNGGRPRKERFKSKAFAYRVNRSEKEIHLLVGHDYDRPLASRLTGGLKLTDTAEALQFEAVIDPAIAETSYGRDVLAQVATGLAFGISPGFRIPPQRTVPDALKDAESDEAEAERLDDEDPAEGIAIIRTISAALLYEISIVTRPAYKETTVQEVRSARVWTPRRVILLP